MARLCKGSVNMDLAKERKRCTFDTEKMTVLLDGGEQFTRRRREIENLMLAERLVMDQTEYSFKTRPEKYNDAMKMSTLFIRKHKELKIDNRYDLWFLLQILFPNETSPIGLHIGMFHSTVVNQASDEQQARWLPKSRSYEMIATYAQTELGHGTHVRNLETTATYDPKTEEFVLHSPTLTSTKFWPGGLGKTTNHAVVMAMLVSNGVNHGLHPFLVQTRDLVTHQPLSGITIGDIGPKFGYDSIDNGFLRFNHVRIPRENLFMKNQEVTKDGRYIKKSKHDKLLYGAMLETRVGIINEPAGRGLRQAVTIAIRYSCVRRQSELKPGDPEPLILEYQTQQYKLLPLLAASYAYAFTASFFMNEYLRLNEEIQRGQVDALPELHAISAGLKATISGNAARGMEQCRLACGGHGFSLASGIPKIYGHALPSCTYEGENTVLLLQTARYLVKMYRQAQKGQPLKGSTAYFSERQTDKSSIQAKSVGPQALLDAYKHRALRLVGDACQRLSRLQGSGKADYDAWNLSSVLLTKAALAHCELYIAKTFLDAILAVKDGALRAVLLDLFCLHSTYEITNSSADYLACCVVYLLKDGYISPEQSDIISESMLSLLETVRPNAVSLVDSFDFTDRHLGSVLGRYDGNVYENLYKWAASSPLNKTEVHESFKYLKNLQQSKL